MDNNIKSNTSFWSEISEYQIQVPYYQRDYAQGRLDGGRIDNIRKVFVEELFGALNGQNTCHLGLVFGSYNEDYKMFIAVDGQQRLTTVFLLHWYVAWRENKLNDYKEKLLHFSWDTRSYSSQFVDLLFKIQPSNIVIDAIKTNSNYFSVWENDPTVKGMLTMLEEIEKQYPEGECDLCSKLFLNDCNIRYDILKLEKNSDEKTYLKMNSRGRSLTTFELFKSKFLDKYQPGFGHKIDNEWLDFMLNKFATSDGRFSDPDIPFMNFINEYTYLKLKLKSDLDNSNDYKEFIEAKVKGELTDVPFISFDKYNCAFEGDCLGSFEKSLDWICHNYEIIKQIDDEVRFSGSRFFLDAIIKDYNPNFSHRAKLFSTFKYAELTGYTPIDTELYKKWTRVFRNLVANTDIDSSNIGGICTAINKIGDSDIYCYLSNGGELTAFAKDQVSEEIAKAKQILNVTLRTDGKSWEDIITEAESYAFFKGAIRFLFTDGEGNINWCDFDTKWENAKWFFNNGVVAPTTAIAEYFNDKQIRDIFSRYSFKAENWKSILLQKSISKPIHQFLLRETVNHTSVLCTDIKNILGSINTHDVWLLQDWQHCKVVLTNYSTRRNEPYKGYVVQVGNEVRNKWNNVVSRISEIEVCVPQAWGKKKIEKYGQVYYRGLWTDIKYNNHLFRYFGNNTVYLMKDDGTSKILKNNKESDKQENTYYFEVTEDFFNNDIDKDKIILEHLNRLIAQVESDKQAL